MRAIQIVQETGPDSALEVVDLPAPDSPDGQAPYVGLGGAAGDEVGGADGGSSGGSGGGMVSIDVRSTGVSFPELLQTRGMYQIKPPLPFVPGSEVSGTVRSAPEGSGFARGERVFGFCGLGGWAEVALAPVHLTFALPEQLSFDQGAAIVLNYHTAWFSLAKRGRLKAGETALIQGAAGGVGTASIQVAKGLGAKTIALVSSEEKREVASRAGADEVVMLNDGWKDEVKELSGGGVDVVLDPVGGERFTDNLRCLRQDGRAIVVGFTAGSIPEVKVNRLLLNNIDVVGAGWGAYLARSPQIADEAAAALASMIEEGVVKPIVGASLPFEQAAEALKTIEERRALGKVVLRV